MTIPGGPNDTDFGLWEGTINWSLQPPTQATRRTGIGRTDYRRQCRQLGYDLLVEGLPVGHTQIDFTAAGGADVTPTLTLVSGHSAISAG